MSADWTTNVSGTSVSVSTYSWPPPEPINPQPDGSVIFDPSAMTVGQPYPYRWYGEWQAVVKAADGTLEFYSLKRRRSLLNLRARWPR